MYRKNVKYTLLEIPQQPVPRIKKPLKLVAFSIVAILVVAVVGVIIYFATRSDSDEDHATGVKIPTGAVTSNGYQCAEIGASILRKGGSAVDAAIAALFCEGISMPQSMGLGGGFLMTIYIKETNTAVALNAREVAPGAATEKMFGGNSSLSSKGGLSVAVPGELKGYWEAYQKYGGKLPWRDLIQPTIDLCKNGVLVTKYLAQLFASQFTQLHKDPGLRSTFINPKTNRTYLENERVKRPRLAKTLELIAEHGADVLYNGSLTEPFVRDIRNNGGIITVDDMKNFKVEWQEPIKAELPFNEILYTSPLPGSGVILNFILNILSDFLDYSNLNSVTNWQRIVESFKYGYGKRTELGDMDFVDVRDLVANLTSPSYAAGIRAQIFDDRTFQDPEHYGANTSLTEDHGTAHISVLAPNGDAVSVTSTINLYFGAGFMSNSTGIILNDEMDDFSSPDIVNSFDLPPSPANYIRPGKRPLSSMCPSIVVGKDGNVKLVVGAAGGSKITTSIALIIMKNLWFNVTIRDALDQKRLHHQLFPMRIQFEEPYKNDTNLVNALHKIGHVYTIASATSGFAAVTSISRENNIIRAATDKRRSGDIAFVHY